MIEAEFFLASRIFFLSGIEHFGYEAGKLRAIGISNHYVDLMVEFANFTRIKPMVNQMEVHPYNQQIELKKWMDSNGFISDSLRRQDRQYLHFWKNMI